MKDQNVCNKIMVKLIQNCTSIFESSPDAETSPDRSTIIVVKVLFFLLVTFMTAVFMPYPATGHLSNSTGSSGG